eukprot:299597-Chlamydomonas_euryale.AAC.5
MRLDGDVGCDALQRRRRLRCASMETWAAMCFNGDLGGGKQDASMELSWGWQGGVLSSLPRAFSCAAGQPHERVAAQAADRLCAWGCLEAGRQGV